MPGRQQASFRVFPLPGVVLFPGNLIPLRIFEARYRELLEKAMNDDKKIVLAMIRPHEEEKPFPGVFQVAGLGDVVHCQRMPDGTFQVILEGVSRVRLETETLDGQVRVFKGRILPDVLKSADKKPVEDMLVELKSRLGTWIEKKLPEPIHANVRERIDAADTQGGLVDRMAGLMVHAVQHRQALLETPDVLQRTKMFETITRWPGRGGPFAHTTMN
ncbi:MAG: LON peptidase substrate-binding domain-containing protein [Planctomycetota bacterium]